MPNRNLAQGLFLAIIALFFGLKALSYPIGTLARFEAGLFPLVISGALLVLALAIIVRSRFVASIPLDFNIKSIAIILMALVGFVVLAKHVNMLAGIVFLVFTAGLAGTSYSVKRSALLAAVLIVVALAFENLLGLRQKVI